MHWKDALQHDGVINVRVRLMTPSQGGRSRSIQSGFKAEWDVGAGRRTTAPLELPPTMRSLAAGDEADVTVFPLEPVAWRNARPGTAVKLLDGNRMIGHGVVQAVRDVPSVDVPLRSEAPRRRSRWRAKRPGAAVLSRRHGWRTWASSARRARGRLVGELLEDRDRSR